MEEEHLSLGRVTHMQESRRMSHVTRVNEAWHTHTRVKSKEWCHTYESGMSHTYARVTSYIQKKGVTWQIWTSHILRINESRHTHEHISRPRRHAKSMATKAIAQRFPPIFPGKDSQKSALSSFYVVGTQRFPQYAQMKILKCQVYSYFA